MRQTARSELELVGRTQERARIDALLEDARDGRSSALLITGDAGIGKSALLGYALARAERMTQLSANGVESESELAFAALADFFQPVLDCLAQIPARQAAALSGAIALGPPATTDRFAVCAATLSLLDAAAEQRPLVGVIDDAQWLDSSSTQALLFASRRLDAEGIVLLIAMREVAGSAYEDVGLEELALAGLERDAVEALLASRLNGAPSTVADRLATATAGNPLAVIELSALLSKEQLAGNVPIDEPFPVLTTVERSFLDRVAALPDTTQQALLVLAASETRHLEDLASALRALGLDLQDLDPAERAQLVEVSRETVAFRHPLLRSAVYHASAAGARRAVHRALAESATGEQSVGRRVWHLAAAASERDEDVASALERVAGETRGRGGHAEASSALERAAELTHDPGLRARRVLQAADDARIAGHAERAVRLLAEALESTTDERLRAELTHLLGVVEMWRGAPLDAYAVLTSGAVSAEAVDKSKAARMLADAAWASFMAGQIINGLEAARKACAVAEESDAVTSNLAGSTLGLGLLLRGQGREAMPYLQRYQALLDEAGTEVRAYHLLRPAGQVLMWLELYDRAREVFDEMVRRARAESALGALPYALAGLAEVDFRTGNWAMAAAGATEAVRIANDTDQRTLLSFALISLARVEAGQGREEQCRAHVVRAVETSSFGSIAAYRLAVLGLLGLGLGRSEEAVEHLRELAHNVRERGLEEPNVIQWAPDLIEAYVRIGRLPDAEAELAHLDRQAEQTGRTWALAAAARCRGLLAPDDQIDDAFAKALAWHDRTTTPFERARTELCFGERLRRARRRTDAREPLQSALETFERLRAAPWAERAATELAATGVTASVRDASDPEALTPQELQVALTVARGATNREAAAALFLSPKTIETHLSRIYRKLNIRSRTELAHRLSSGEFASATSA